MPSMYARSRNAQVVVGQALTARQQAVSKLLGFECSRSARRFRTIPCCCARRSASAALRRAARLRTLRMPPPYQGAARAQRASPIASSSASFVPGTDREVSRVRGVAEQHAIAVVPASVGDLRENEPRVRQDARRSTSGHGRRDTARTTARRTRSIQRATSYRVRRRATSLRGIRRSPCLSSHRIDMRAARTSRAAFPRTRT